MSRYKWPDTLIKQERWYNPGMATSVTQWLHDILGGARPRTQARAAHGGDPNKPVEVFTATNAMEAELVRALLESEGIPAHISGTALSDVYGLQVGPLAEVKVFTIKAFTERAQQIIDERYLETDGAEREFENAWDEEDTGRI